MADVKVDIKLQTNAQQVSKDFKSVDQAVADLRAEVLRLDKTANQNLLDFKFTEAEREIKSLRGEAARLIRDLEQPIELKLDTSAASRALFDAKSLKSTKDVTGDLSSGASALAQGAGILSPGLAGSFQAVSDLTGAAEGLSLLSLNAAPLAAVSIAGAAGLALLNKAMSDQEKVVKELSQAERDRVQLIIKTRDDLRSLSVSEAQQRIEDLKVQIEADTSARDNLVRAFASSIGQVDSIGDAILTTIGGVAEGLGLAKGEIATSKNELDDWNKKLSENQDELNRLTNEVLPAIAAKQASQEVVDAILYEQQVRADLENTIRTSTAAQIEDRLELIRIDEQTTQQAKAQLDARIAAFYQQNDATLTILEGYIQQGGNAAVFARQQRDILLAQVQPFEAASAAAASTLEQLTIQETALVTNALPLVRAREEESAAIEKLNKLTNERQTILANIAKVEASISAAVEQERDKRAKRELVETRKAEDLALSEKEQALKAQLDQEKKAAQLQTLVSERRERITEIDQTYYQESLDALAEFRKSEQRLDRDFYLSRQRALEDLSDQLTDAASANDVLQFVQLQKAGEKQLRRDAEDFGIGKGDRLTDFADQTSDLRRQRDQEIAEIRTNYAQRLQVTTEAESAITRALADIQRQKAALQVARSAEDTQQQLQAERQNFLALMSERQQQRAALIRDLADTGRQAVQLSAQTGRGMAQAFVSGLFDRSGSGQTASLRVPQASTQRFTATAFAEGGLAMTPTIALLGEKPGWGDVVLPFRQSQGVGSAFENMPAQPPIIVNANNWTVSDIATKQDIVNTIRDTVLAGMKQGREQTA